MSMKSVAVGERWRARQHGVSGSATGMALQCKSEAGPRPNECTGHPAARRVGKTASKRGPICERLKQPSGWCAPRSLRSPARTTSARPAPKGAWAHDGCTSTTRRRRRSNPILTLGAIEFASILGGAIITEQIFGLDGVGRLAVSAANNGDATGRHRLHTCWARSSSSCATSVVDIITHARSGSVPTATHNEEHPP